MRRVEEEVVTAWRVVKRRMAEGARGSGMGDEGTGGHRERGGATVYASRVGRRDAEGLREGKGWPGRRVADHAEVGRLALSL